MLTETQVIHIFLYILYECCTSNEKIGTGGVTETTTRSTNKVTKGEARWPHG